MYPSIIEAAARDQINGRIAEAARVRTAAEVRSAGRAARAQRRSARRDARAVRSTQRAVPTAGLANKVRHPVGAFVAWVADGQL
jgi:hypothetical protein